MSFLRTFADGDRLTVAGAVVTLKVHRRARRVSLRLDRVRREIVATAPSARRLGEAAAFARERADWICERLAELPRAESLHPGRTIEVLGEPVLLTAGKGRARWIEPTGAAPAAIAAMGEGEGYARAVVLVLRRRARAFFAERTAAYAERLGAPVPKVTVMDARARWGSCRAGLHGTAGHVRYSWRLMLAPLAVADYVAAHECAHLLEQNHGPRFWSHVRGLVGDERRFRSWLRLEGARLHAFGG